MDAIYNGTYIAFKCITHRAAIAQMYYEDITYLKYSRLSCLMHTNIWFNADDTVQMKHALSLLLTDAIPYFSSSSWLRSSLIHLQIQQT